MEFAVGEHFQVIGSICRVQATDNGVAGNLYAIIFGREGNGFVLGNDAILLKYIASERLT